MRVLRLACLLIVVALLAAASPPCLAQGTPVQVSPTKVAVDASFSGADVAMAGTAPADAQAIVKVTAAPRDVRLSKKDRVMGLFWMTTERAVVENMPAFLALYTSQPLDTLLSEEEQIRLGVDADCVGLMNLAKAVADSANRAPVPTDQAQMYIESLRNIYIRNAKYVPCLSCHRAEPGGAAHGPAATPPGGVLRLTQGNWDLSLHLPADAPLGDYQVTAYYVKDGRVVATQTGSFQVAKAGLVATLGTLATENPPLYGALSLGVVILVGMGVGIIFPRGRH